MSTKTIKRVLQGMVLRALPMLLLVIFIIAILIVAFFDAEKNRRSFLFTTEYFSCRYSEDKSEITILELTELGRQQEILVIPAAIKGVPVVQLGSYISGCTRGERYRIESQRLKKLYFFADNFFLKHALIYVPNATVVACGNIQKFNSDMENWRQLKINYRLDENAPILKNWSEYWTSILDSYNVGCEKRIMPVLYENDFSDFPEYVAANVRYYIDNELSYIDYIDSQEKYILPKIGNRDGYTFDGWYTEKECINKWNEEVPQFYEEELNLYARWLEN